MGQSLLQEIFYISYFIYFSCCHIVAVHQSLSLFAVVSSPPFDSQWWSGCHVAQDCLMHLKVVWCPPDPNSSLTGSLTWFKTSAKLGLFFIYNFCCRSVMDGWMYGRRTRKHVFLTAWWQEPGSPSLSSAVWSPWQSSWWRSPAEVSVWAQSDWGSGTT